MPIDLIYRKKSNFLSIFVGINRTKIKFQKHFESKCFYFTKIQKINKCHKNKY